MKGIRETDIYALELHETKEVSDGSLFVQVLRVPGGWIYHAFDKSHNILSSLFVPFNNEFQSSDKEKVSNE